MREIRRFRPHVMTTYDEQGGYPHPDHIMCHDVSTAAFDASGDRFPTAGPAWQPLKLYYNGGFSRARIEVAYHQALLDAGRESVCQWLARLADRPQRRVTTRIDCAAWFGSATGPARARPRSIPTASSSPCPARRRRRCAVGRLLKAAASVVPIVETGTTCSPGAGPGDADALATSAPPLAYDERVARVVAV